jgi:hypothetical protein
MSELIYLLSILVTLGAYAAGVWILWQGVELGYWIFCKITGRDH